MTSTHTGLSAPKASRVAASAASLGEGEGADAILDNCGESLLHGSETPRACTHHGFCGDIWNMRPRAEVFGDK